MRASVLAVKETRVTALVPSASYFSAMAPTVQSLVGDAIENGNGIESFWGHLLAVAAYSKHAGINEAELADCMRQVTTALNTHEQATALLRAPRRKRRK